VTGLPAAAVPCTPGTTRTSLFEHGPVGTASGVFVGDATAVTLAPLEPPAEGSADTFECRCPGLAW
jgi:hypothetical protein